MKNVFPTKSYFLNFYGRRGLRIFPLYYLYLVIVTFACLALNLGGHSNKYINDFLSTLLWSFTYTYNFYHATDFYLQSPLVTHFWSLAVEEQFYLLWPLIIWSIRKEHLKWVLLIGAFSGPISRLALDIIQNSGIFPRLNSRPDLVIYVLPFSHVDAFAFGGLFALYGKNVAEKYSWIALVSFVTYGFIYQWGVTAQFPPISSLGFPAFMKNNYIMGYTVINVLLAFIIRQVSNGRFAAPLFENKIAYFTGKISYGLYVFHLPSLWVVPIIMPNHGVRYINEIIALLLTIAIAAFSYFLFESRITRLKDIYFPIKTKT